MGPPGAGKGTQAKLLADKISYCQFSTGSAFRDVAMQDTDLGRRVKKIIDNGYLAPPEMAAEIVTTAVQKHLEHGRGLIFDGTPRTVREAQIVDDFFIERGLGDPLPILLAVDKNEMMRRSAEREFCLTDQGDDFPVATQKDRERCREAGGTVGRRPDDDPQKFATRWGEFLEQTQPVIEQYRERGILKEVDGMRSIAEVHEEVMGVVNSFQNPKS